MSDFIPRIQEFKGRTIDEAIFRGITEMGLTLDQVSIETMQIGSKGILGITKPCIVRLVERDPREVSEFVPEPLPREERPERPRRERDGRPRRESPREERNARPREEREYEQRPVREREAVVDKTPYVRYIPGENGVDGCEFLAGLVERMKLNSTVSYAEQDGIRLRVDTDPLGILIGHRGETLDALQYLVGLVVNKGEGYRRVTVDVENYRAKRDQTLTRLAHKIATHVKSTGEPVALEPMNPYERRVLHYALQNDLAVTTRSEGEEPHRHVIVEPRS